MRFPVIFRSSRQASVPDILGMLTSRITKSGFTCSNCSTASAPSPTVCTMKPAPASAASASIRCDGSSSAIRIVVGRFAFVIGILMYRCRTESLP